MNKRELKNQLKDLPRYQFVLLAGGSLVMRGLRDEASDIDICVSEGLARELKVYDQKPDEHGIYKLPDGMDVMVGMHRVNCELVDGYLCERLEDILDFKQRRNLSKDRRDIEVIEEYFTQQGRS